MISRIWRGLSRPASAEMYVEHLRKETFPKLRTIPGFIDASILRRNLDHGVEFLVVTRWKSMKAVEQFAGRNPDAAVVPENVHAMMIEYDHSVRHYDIVE